jgi:5-methylcytosine-specific restriction endonuclease McrA
MGGYETKKQQRDRAKRRRDGLSPRERRLEQLKYAYGLEVAERFIDATQCELCGFERQPHYVHIHHKDHNHKNNDLSNVIGICWYCHKEIHMQEGYK